MSQEKCSIPECNGKIKIKGWCNRHYMIWYRYGNPTSYKRSKKNNKTKRAEYIIWAGIKQRCHDKNYASYADYGGRGIKVCDRWLDIVDGFDNFLKDMGERPKNLSIDRIDNDGDYTPENCRWATNHQQSWNRRMRKDNTTGRTGIYRFRGQWTASIRYKNRYIFLGYFDDKIKAIQAREQAEVKYGVK